MPPAPSCCGRTRPPIRPAAWATSAIRHRDAEWAEALLEASRVDDVLVTRLEAAGIEVAKAETAAATGAATITVEAMADVELEIDGGTLPGVPSTVVDLREYEAHGDWQILRQGALPLEAAATDVAAGAGSAMTDIAGEAGGSGESVGSSEATVPAASAGVISISDLVTTAGPSTGCQQENR